jgi:hypothetical protein
MSSFFFTFFSTLFGTGFRDPFYQFSPAWQDFFFTFFKFFVTFLLRFCYSFLRPLRKAISRLCFIVPFWHGKTFLKYFFRAFDSLAPACSPFGLPVYVARLRSGH